MRLSDAIREKISFESNADGFLPFQRCVQKAFPYADADTFPLAFSCPLFVGLKSPYRATTIANGCLPDGRKLPYEGGIYFLCDAIDAMAYAEKMSPAQVADVVKNIEERFLAEGLDWNGDALDG